MLSLTGFFLFSGLSLVLAWLAHSLCKQIPKQLLTHYYAECKAALNHPTPIPEPFRFQPLIIIACVAYFTFICLYQYGITSQGLSAIVLGTLLVTASIIDIQTRLLPDCLLYPGIWLGVLINLQQIWVPIHLSVLGVILGYLIPWLLIQVGRLSHKKELMGYGDCKLIGLIGAWFGLPYLPGTLMIACGLALLYRLLFIPFGGNREKSFAFGPFLSLASLIVLQITPSKLTSLVTQLIH